MNGNDPRGKDGAGEGSSPDDDLSARLKRLEMQIDRKRPAAAPDPSSRHGSGEPSSLGIAMRLSTEFVAASWRAAFSAGAAIDSSAPSPGA